MYLYYLYLILILLSPLRYFLPSSIVSISAALRELTLLLIFIISIIKFLIKSYSKKIYLFEIVTWFYIIIVFFYSSISEYNYELIQNIVLYVSGPLIFVFTPYFITNQEKAKVFIKNTSIILFVYLIVNLIIFPVQYELLLLSTAPQEDRIYLYRTTSDGSLILRFFGLVFMPTSLGWICVVVLLSPFSKIIKKSMSFLSLYLTMVRLFYPGMAYAYFVSIKKVLRIYLFFILIPIVFLLLFYLSKNMDSSLNAHLQDILWNGPTLMIENIMGVGFNKTIKVESDIYMSVIQFGAWGGCVYIVVFLLLYNFLKKKEIKYDKIIIYAKQLTIVFFIGSFFLPLTSQRILSNIYWIIISVICSYGQISIKNSNNNNIN
jgi:hypothetical protein